MVKASKKVDQPTVSLHIVPGKGTEHQKKLWSTFWTRIIAAEKDEGKK